MTPLSLRIGVAGGLAETVIDRNTPVPIEQTAVFTTFKDFQQSVKIRVYQGESRVQEENELLGEFEFSGFKHARRGEVRIEVTFEIDTDGIVNVTARDPDTGQVASTQIHLSSGLSEEEIQAIVAKHQPAAPPPPPPSAAEAIAALPRRAAAVPDPAPAVAGPALTGLDDLDTNLDTELDTELAVAAEPTPIEEPLAAGAGGGAEAPPLRGDEIDLDASPAGPIAAEPAAGPDIEGAQEYELDLGAGGDVELAAAGASLAAPPSADAERTLAIGGEIDLEALETDAAAGGSLAGEDVDLDPLDLDENDLDSLATIADEAPSAADDGATAVVEQEEGAITRPRPSGGEPARERGSLFDEPGSDLSRYQDDDES